MSDLIDKIFTFGNGENIEFRSSIKRKMKKAFNEAVQDKVDRQNDNMFTEGVAVVLYTMDKHGLSESAKIVERLLVDDGIIEIDIDDYEEEPGEEQEQKPGKDEFISAVSSMIG